MQTPLPVHQQPAYHTGKIHALEMLLEHLNFEVAKEEDLAKRSLHNCYEQSRHKLSCVQSYVNGMLRSCRDMLKDAEGRASA